MKLLKVLRFRIILACLNKGWTKQVEALVQYVGSGSWWAQTMVYGLNFLERDGEKIILLFMLPLAQNHGKMYTRCKIVVIELEC